MARDSVTFVHAADLHLDAPFQGMSADEERVGRELAEATYDAWHKVVDLAIARGVDFVVLSGDVHNAGDRSLRAELRMREEAQRLADAEIPLFVVHGNHDPLDGWSAGIAMPDNVHVFSAGRTERFEAVSEDGFCCAVYGRSYGTRSETSDFTPGYRREAADTVAVGVLHANVGGNKDYEPYAPCSIDDLRACGMDYWALGHIHKHEVLATDPYIVQAGSPQGLNPKETGVHGCCVVTIDRSRAVSFSYIDLAPIAWAVADIDVSGAETVDEVESRVNAALDAIRTDTQRPTVARVTLSGRSAVHGMLVRPRVLDDLRDALRSNHLSRSPWLWLDRIRDNTAGVIDLAALHEVPEFSGEVVRVADDLAETPDRLKALVDEIAEPVAQKFSGYAPGADAKELLERARDRALDLLLADGGVS